MSLYSRFLTFYCRVIFFLALGLIALTLFYCSVIFFLALGLTALTLFYYRVIFFLALGLTALTLFYCSVIFFLALSLTALTFVIDCFSGMRIFSFLTEFSFFHVQNLHSFIYFQPVFGCFCPISRTFSFFLTIFSFFQESLFPCLWFTKLFGVNKNLLGIKPSIVKIAWNNDLSED